MTTIISLTILVISAILHEIAHGVAALALGDRTALEMKRITLNPISHIDPFMTILVPLSLILAGSPIVFGGAKPVPVDPRNFKRPRQGMALVALAGPVSNILIAGVLYLLMHLLLGVADPDAPGSLAVLTFQVLLIGILINIVLAAFNLLPVPPLDGGRIVVGILPLNLARAYSRLERYGLIIVVVLLLSGVVDKILDPLIDTVIKVISQTG